MWTTAKKDETEDVEKGIRPLLPLLSLFAALPVLPLSLLLSSLSLRLLHASSAHFYSVRLV